MYIYIYMYIYMYVERVVGVYGEPTHHPAPLGSIPMDLGAIQGPTSHSGTHPRRGGNGNCSIDKLTCHYYKQPSHFIFSCLKLKQYIEAKAAG